jgi:hypothetical protein
LKSIENQGFVKVKRGEKRKVVLHAPVAHAPFLPAPLRHRFDGFARRIPPGGSPRWTACVLFRERASVPREETGKGRGGVFLPWPGGFRTKKSKRWPGSWTFCPDVFHGSRVASPTRAGSWKKQT